MYDNDGLALQSFYNIFLDAHGNILIISHHVHSVCIGQDLKYLEWCAVTVLLGILATLRPYAINLMCTSTKV